MIASSVSASTSRATHGKRLKASDVRGIAANWVRTELDDVTLGLPEWDDRISQWRVALMPPDGGNAPIGEVRVSSGGTVTFTTDLAMARRRKLNDFSSGADSKPNKKRTIKFAPIPSTLALGDAREVLSEFPEDTAQLVFTSPPYYNAKPEYHESHSYDEYLAFLGEVFERCHAVLSEGRFLVVNTSPVLIRRASRSTSSRRLPITYDLHSVLRNIGFEFIDDIVWQKPEGAGWHLGRGRRFAADRQPLQYKPVTVTEYVTVYRKQTDRLIDWNIRYHPDQAAVKASRVEDGYERTNIWRLAPAHHKQHPAVFPAALAERVIRYYSFRGDLVLDPFAGTGTVARVADELGRRFLLVEKSPEYFKLQQGDPAITCCKPCIISYH